MLAAYCCGKCFACLFASSSSIGMVHSNVAQCQLATVTSVSIAVLIWPFVFAVFGLYKPQEMAQAVS